MDAKEIRMKGIPSAKKMESVTRHKKVDNEQLGELAIACMGELLGVLRTFVAEKAKHQKSFSGYLDAYDRAVKREMRFLNGLPPGFKMELGVFFLTRGLLDEFVAYDQLLKGPEGEAGDGDKEKKKQAGSTLKKSISGILPSWFPEWLETIIEEILELL